MPSLQVQTYTLSDGTELSFTDSGAPPDSMDYTTVLFLHGGIFNAYQFYKVHTYAHPLNLRTVLLHRRDYAGSTSYSPTEIAELEQGNAAFWERLSAQVLEFLRMFIDRERIPKLIPRRKSQRTMRSHVWPEKSTHVNAKLGNGFFGGVTIFGWSAGCSTVLSLLGATHNRYVSEELYKDLQQYVGKCMIYDPSYYCFGYTLPPDSRNSLYIPWEDSAVSAEHLSKAVADWISSYYDHPCYDPVSRSLPSAVSIRALDGLSKHSDHMSISHWTDEDIEKGLEGKPAANEMLAFLPPMQKTLRLLSEQALFDAKSASTWFPDVEVTYIGGTKSGWVCAWAEIETKNRYYSQAKFYSTRSSRSSGDATGNYANIRKIRFLDMDGSNHFAHWDQPQEFMQVIAQGIRFPSLGS